MTCHRCSLLASLDDLTGEREGFTDARGYPNRGEQAAFEHGIERAMDKVREQVACTCKQAAKEAA